MLGKMTLTENRPSGAEIFVNRNVVSSLLGPPNIATLANKFVTGSPVSKFWTVNLSTDGHLVGGTGVMVNRIFILFSLFIQLSVLFVPVLTIGNMQKNVSQYCQKQCKRNRSHNFHKWTDK